LGGGAAAPPSGLSLGSQNGYSAMLALFTFTQA